MDQPARQNPPIPMSMNAAFLRRTAIATLITTLLVALFTAVYAGPKPGGIYLTFSLWTLVFFTLSVFSFRYFFSGQRLFGLVCVFLKLVMLIGLVFVPRIFLPQTFAEQIAIFAGVSTPILVLVLRALGFMMELSRQSKKPIPAAGNEKSGGSSRQGELKLLP